MRWLAVGGCKLVGEALSSYAIDLKNRIFVKNRLKVQYLDILTATEKYEFAIEAFLASIGHNGSDKAPICLEAIISMLS